MHGMEVAQEVAGCDTAEESLTASSVAADSDHAH